jgi:hypothetical protein
MSKPNIHPVFKETVGQEFAKLRLSQSIYSGANDGIMAQPLLEAEPGNGKSHLMRLTIDGYRAAGFDTLYFNSPEEFREGGANFDSLLQLLTGDRKFAIAIDEFHMIDHRKTVRLEKVKAFLMKALDKGNDGKDIRFDSSTLVNFSRRRGCFLLGTNFPGALDKSGAFQSRCDRIQLDLYSVEELVEILQGMLHNEGFSDVAENTLKQIARCGRGTARPMERLVDQIKMEREAKGEKRTTINRENVLTALKMCRMYPKGLSMNEVKLLLACEQPQRNNVMLAQFPNIESKVLDKTKSYLITEGLGVQLSAGFQRTTWGTQYLADIKKEGFVVPKV